MYLGDPLKNLVINTALHLDTDISARDDDSIQGSSCACCWSWERWYIFWPKLLTLSLGGFEKTFHTANSSNVPQDRVQVSQSIVGHIFWGPKSRCLNAHIRASVAFPSSAWYEKYLQAQFKRCCIPATCSQIYIVTLNLGDCPWSAMQGFLNITSSSSCKAKTSH